MDAASGPTSGAATIQWFPEALLVAAQPVVAQLLHRPSSHDRTGSIITAGRDRLQHVAGQCRPCWASLARIPAGVGQHGPTAADAGRRHVGKRSRIPPQGTLKPTRSVGELFSCSSNSSPHLSGLPQNTVQQSFEMLRLDGVWPRLSLDKVMQTSAEISLCTILGVCSIGQWMRGGSSARSPKLSLPSRSP